MGFRPFLGARKGSLPPPPPIYVRDGCAFLLVQVRPSIAGNLFYTKLSSKYEKPIGAGFAYLKTVG